MWKTAGVLISLALAAASISLVQISSDPYTNATASHRTEVEPDSFAFGSTIVSAFQVGRIFDGGCTNIGWATSTDGGGTWRNGLLPGLTTASVPPGPYPRASDPAVTYDAAHDTWMISSLALMEGPDRKVGSTTLVTSLSTDGGISWGSPLKTAPSGNLDKNWIACDNHSNTSPYYGHCYCTWDDVSFLGRIRMSTSTDGGRTWGPAKSPSSNSNGIGGQPVIQPGGTVVVPFLTSTVSSILAFRSTDGGGTWGAAVTISNVVRHTVAAMMRTAPLPAAEVDRAGKVYVVWQDARFRTRGVSNDIVMSTSTDGMRWSRVTRIPIDEIDGSVDHFIPAIAVDGSTAGADAHLVLAYYYYPDTRCTTATCRLHVGYVTSIDGGESGSEPVQLAGPMMMSWLPLTSQGYMVGDYISTSFVGSQAFPVFAQANAPTGAVLDQFMVTTRSGIDPTLGPSTGARRSTGERPAPDAVSDGPEPTAPVTAR